MRVYYYYAYLVYNYVVVLFLETPTCNRNIRSFSKAIRV